MPSGAGLFFQFCDPVFYPSQIVFPLRIAGVELHQPLHNRFPFFKICKGLAAIILLDQHRADFRETDNQIALPLTVPGILSSKGLTYLQAILKTLQRRGEIALRDLHVADLVTGDGTGA